MSHPALLPETLMLAGMLGLRHGLDPDHLAVIDGLTYRAISDRPHWAPWTGALFSIGHSVSVMLIALGLGGLGLWFAWPPVIDTALEWLVIGLLLTIGIINLKSLLGAAPYRPTGWKHGLLPDLANGSSHPLVILGIGLMFGLVIDTAAQIAALSATVTSSHNLSYPALIGFVFALGMIFTDGLDSLLIARLSRNGLRHAAIYRRITGWLIVILSFGVAIMAIARQTGLLSTAP